MSEINEDNHVVEESCSNLPVICAHVLVCAYLTSIVNVDKVTEMWKEVAMVDKLDVSSF